MLIVGVLLSDLPMDSITNINNKANYKVFIIGMFFMLGLAFGNSAYINMPVLEIQTKLRYTLYAMGCKRLPY